MRGGSLLRYCFPAGYLVPDLEALLHEGTINRGTETMSFEPKMIGDRTKGREEALCMARGFETPHGSLSLPGSLVRTFRTIVQALMLAVLNTGHDFPLCCSVTGQLVGNDDPWYVLQAFEQLAEEFLGYILVATALHQDIQHMAILINRPP